MQCAGFLNRNQFLCPFQFHQLVVVRNARQLQAVNFFVLAHHGIHGAAQNGVPCHAANVSAMVPMRGIAAGGEAGTGGYAIRKIDEVIKIFLAPIGSCSGANSDTYNIGIRWQILNQSCRICTQLFT